MRSRLLLVLALLMAAGCGSGSGSSSGSSSAPSGGKLIVFAASSLIDAFPKIATTYQQQHSGWKVEFEFLGSDQLAAQIEQGDPADVFAAASTKYPEQLQGENLLGKTDLPTLTAEMKARGVDEPLIIDYDPANEEIRVAEGNHRIAAARKAGLDYLPVRVYRSDRPFATGFRK